VEARSAAAVARATQKLHALLRLRPAAGAWALARPVLVYRAAAAEVFMAISMFRWALVPVFVSLGAAAPANAAVRPTISAGTGFTELVHAEGGVYVTPQLALEASAVWAGMFGFKLGVGGTYALARGLGGRPPQHAFLIGARAMIGPDLRFHSEADSLGAYGLVFGGYGFNTESGLSVRFMGGPVLLWEQAPLAASGQIQVRWPFVLGSVGWVF
jgi:hypothetical protein